VLLNLLQQAQQEIVPINSLSCLEYEFDNCLQSDDPKANTLIVGTLSLDANRAEREHRTKVNEFLAAWQPGSGMMSWEADKKDRIY
jgi:hypothetical protein